MLALREGVAKSKKDDTHAKEGRAAACSAVHALLLAACKPVSDSDWSELCCCDM